MTDLRQAEPVAWMSSDRAWMWSDYSKAIAAVANIPTLTLIPLYVAPPMPVQEDAFEGWVKIDEVHEHFDAVNCGTIYKHGGEGRVPLYTAPPQRQWDKPSASFNEWWNGDYEDPANPFEKDSAAYWAWAGWKAAQRPWVGLTDVDVKNLELTSATSSDVRNISAELKEKNT